MYRLRYLLCLLTLGLSGALTAGRAQVVAGHGDVAAQADTALAREYRTILTHLYRAAGFDNDYPREKVYLHLDNNAYFTGDTIWYKAYVVRASTLRPEPVSRVLYVELLDAGGRMVDQKLLRLDSLGQAHGDFVLQQPVHAGYHEVRAYTREMTNWGPEACFSRVIPVFDRPKEGRQLTLNTPEVDRSKGDYIGHIRPFYNDRPRALSLSFYPEGGWRVTGAAQRIAFRLVDNKGAAVPDSLTVYAATGTMAGRAVATTAAWHQGMGSFVLPAGVDSVYAVVGKKRIPLPSPQPLCRYALTAGAEADTIRLDISPTPSAPQGDVVGVAGFCRGRLFYRGCFVLNDQVRADGVHLALPRTALPGGILQFVLFNTEGQTLARRMVWNDAEATQAQVSIRQNARTYQPYQPVVLEMDVNDAQGQPLQGTFSLAVRDDGGELVVADAADTQTAMLLSSEVRGYIHRPEQYFAVNDAAHRRALDLLLMVQGWTANTFEQMCGRDTMEVRQPIEESLTLRGQVFRANNRREPYPGLALKIQMYSQAGASLSAEAVTDSAGRFAFVSNVDYVGPWIAVVTTRDSTDRRRMSRVTFDRWFSPQPQRFCADQLSIATPQPADTADVRYIADDEVFAWTDTIRRYVRYDLGEAVAKARRRYRGLQGTRYSVNGGEKAGMRRAHIFINVERELERYKDAGEAPGTAAEFISRLISGSSLRYGHQQTSTEMAGDLTDVSGNIQESRDMGDVASESIFEPDAENEQQVLWVGNEEARVLLNNAEMNNSQIPLNEKDVEEIRSVAIMSAQSGGQVSNTQSSAKRWTVSIYEEPMAYRFRTKRGVDKRRMMGYAEPLKFFSPSYNGLDLPSEADQRRTLYWNPDLRTDAKGHANILFYNNAHSDVVLRLSLRGVTPDGTFVDFDR
ncbi:MAG: hypothetical protein MR624_05145 [Bacteroidales bacterium]|nr:hypothetical protein [Bacteroidales bacterium]